VTSSFDKKLQFWDTKTGSINSINTVKLESHVASLSICGMYLLAAVARNVYVYDIRNLSGPTKAKDCPLMYDIQCLQASPEWNGMILYFL
jgi:cell cycle arrest protein BUB3